MNNGALKKPKVPLTPFQKFQKESLKKSKLEHKDEPNFNHFKNSLSEWEKLDEATKNQMSKEYTEEIVIYNAEKRKYDSIMKEYTSQNQPSQPEEPVNTEIKEKKTAKSPNDSREE